jgi:hypothetical protein
MKNSEIKYKTSTDYEKLYQLLKEDNILIGFMSIEYNNKISDEYSKLVTMSYNAENKFFDIGFIFFEPDFDKILFIKLCEKYHVRFIEF